MLGCGAPEARGKHVDPILQLLHLFRLVVLVHLLPVRVCVSCSRVTGVCEWLGLALGLGLGMKCCCLLGCLAP